MPTPIAWYDAALVSSFTIASSAVSVWADRMATYDASQGTSGDRPEYGSRTINGIVVPDFVSSDRLDSACPRDDVTSTSFVVAASDTIASNRTLLCGNGGTGGNQLRQTGSSDIQTLAEAGSNIGTHTAALVVSQPFVVAQVLTATTADHWALQSGVMGLTRSTAAHSVSLTAGRTLRIGARSNASEVWDGQIAEVIIYDRTLTDAEVRRNFAYLSRKWGILAP